MEGLALPMADALNAKVHQENTFIYQHHADLNSMLQHANIAA